MSEFFDLVEEIRLRDKRYKPDAYEFVLQGLTFTQKKFKKPDPNNAKHSTGQAHVTGRELASGLRDFAIDQYGALAHKVLAHWGINQTEDFGNIVFSMIEKKLLSKTEEDCLADFASVYDFKAAFSNVLTDSVIEGFKGKR
jgi:uncharacterized repeat protein (TIGR04138 family)